MSGKGKAKDSAGSGGPAKTGVAPGSAKEQAPAKRWGHNRARLARAGLWPMMSAKPLLGPREEVIATFVNDAEVPNSEEQLISRIGDLRICITTDLLQHLFHIPGPPDVVEQTQLEVPGDDAWDKIFPGGKRACYVPKSDEWHFGLAREWWSEWFAFVNEEFLMDYSHTMKMSEVRMAIAA